MSWVAGIANPFLGDAQQLRPSARNFKIMRALKIVKWLIVGALLAVAALVIHALAQRNPEDLPWTSLDLDAPIGMFTGRKLAGLTDDAPLCLALLAEAEIAHVALPEREAGERCGYVDGVRFTGASGGPTIAYTPRDITISCPVAAALAIWGSEVVQPAAFAAFGQRVATIEHFGGYSCRRMYGASEGRWSEHATADAVDIAAFVLADGTRISVIGDWTGSDSEARFLRQVRDGACDLFATVLSPDYNAAHADHFHFDQAERGAIGGRVCR